MEVTVIALGGHTGQYLSPRGILQRRLAHIGLLTAPHRWNAHEEVIVLEVYALYALPVVTDRRQGSHLRIALDLVRRDIFVMLGRGIRKKSELHIPVSYFYTR